MKLASPTLERPVFSSATIKLYGLISAAVLLALIVLSFIRVWAAWHNDGSVSFAEGVWLTCAWDFAHGIFYRPVLGPLGIGGTRYFPLYFVLVGGLNRFIGTIQYCGYIISELSELGLFVCVYIIARRLSGRRMFAVAAVAAVLVAGMVQASLLTTRGDATAALFDLLGITVFLSSKSRRVIVPVSLLFGLAFATKQTEIFGFLAVSVFLGLSREWKQLARLAAVTAGANAVTLAAMYLGSSGRVFSIFRACASAGATWKSLILGPARMLTFELVSQPFTLVVFLFATSIVVRSFLRRRFELLDLFFAFATVLTAIVYGSPGTTSNHLLIVHITSVLVIVDWAAQDFAQLELAWGVLAIGATAAILVPVRNMVNTPNISLRAERQAIVAKVSSDPRPILSEDPMIAIQKNQAPYILDRFLLKVLVQKQPEIAAHLTSSVEGQRFSAVVLEENPNTPEGRRWYSEGYLGERFLKALNKQYQYEGAHAEEYVFLPKHGRSTGLAH